MMNENIMMEKLRELKLSGFIESIVEQRTSKRYLELAFEDRLLMLVDRECLRRDNQRLTTRLKNSHIPQSSASLDALDLRIDRGISKSQLLELGTCRWVKDRLSLIVTGPTGVGKSFISCALADQACRLGLTALYMRTSDLIAELLLAKNDGSFKSLKKRLSKVDLLIIDDFLRDPLEAVHVREFLDLIDDRFRRASCLFVSQLPVTDWHRNITDPTIADALLDRIVHDALRLELKGESMRKRTSPVDSSSKSGHVASLREPLNINLIKEKTAKNLTKTQATR
jgi:DNA replication protein DnaC